MLSRRSFLTGAATAAVAQGLSGCGSSAAQVQVRLLKGSIPPQLLGEFRRSVSQGSWLALKPESQLEDLFALLQTGTEEPEGHSTGFGWLPGTSRPRPAVAQLLTLGDAWLERAVRERSIAPLTLTELPGWQRLPLPWQQLVRRNREGYPDPGGAIWGAPYRWGTTLMAYRRDKFEALGWKPGDWGDLWREDLRRRLSLVDRPREVIGLTLKKLGYSYNTPDLDSIPNLKSELRALQEQVRTYSSDRYLQPLILGDVWLAVGWSGDILPVVARHPNLQAAIPRSGTALWTDLWVQPRQANLTDLAKEWIEFCWRVKSANEISLLTQAVSPILLSLKPDEIAQEVRDDPLRSVDPSLLQDSEFILPLSPAARRQYQARWKEMRLGLL